MLQRRRLFAGHRVRELRLRHGFSQSAFARRIGISVSYLSQIENDDRPLTSLVLLALAREFPGDWGTPDEEETLGLLLATAEASVDASIPAERLPEDSARRAVEQQPQLARRLVAVHAAYRRALEQLRVLDDKLESGPGEPGQLPWEEVRDWFQAEGNYVDAIDRSAEHLADGIVDDGGALGVAEGIERRLRGWHGIRVVHRESDGAALSRFDGARGELAVDGALPPESRAFLLAHQLVRVEFVNEMRRVVDGSGLHSGAARELLEVGLANYAAGALLMPYGAFRAAAQQVRHDIDRLRQRFGVSFEQACHRLSTLQRPGAQGLPFFFCRVDMAGNITKRHSATRLQFARFGGACPLWVVHEAVAIPDRILVQRAEMPDGTRYVSMAKGLVKPSGSFTRAPRRYAVALGCEESHAGGFVYADALSAAAPTPIGASCRICPRTLCDQRAFPPAASVIEIDRDTRTIVPYRFR